jgi:hypothetical protein
VRSASNAFMLNYIQLGIVSSMCQWTTKGCLELSRESPQQHCLTSKNEEIIYYVLLAISYWNVVVHANKEVDSLVAIHSPKIDI